MQHTFAQYRAAADYVLARAPFVPEIGIVLGSCLGPFAQELEASVSIDYADIPNFLVTTVASHAGKLVFGTVRGKRVVCMSGRFIFMKGTITNSSPSLCACSNSLACARSSSPMRQALSTKVTAPAM